MKNVNTPLTLKDRAVQAIDAYLEGGNHMTNCGLMEGLISALGGSADCHECSIDYRDNCDRILDLLQSDEIDITFKKNAIEMIGGMRTFFDAMYFNEDMKAELERACIVTYDPYDDEYLENLIRRYELKKQLDDLEKKRIYSRSGSEKKEAA